MNQGVELQARQPTCRFELRAVVESADIADAEIGNGDDRSGNAPV